MRFYRKIKYSKKDVEIKQLFASYNIIHVSCSKQVEDSFWEDISLEQITLEWESDMTCYPCFVNYGTRVYMFYNGNNYGASGIGWAELK